MAASSTAEEGWRTSRGETTFVRASFTKEKWHILTLQ
jgi:hypothetical protein